MLFNHKTYIKLVFLVFDKLFFFNYGQKDPKLKKSLQDLVCLKKF